MIDTNQLNADEAIADAERLLYEEYIFHKRHQAQARKPQEQTRRDGLVIIAAWCVVVWILVAK